jgi:hypothetical protein
MELVKGGWTLTLGLALSISACAYSITSTFDPWTVDSGLDSSSSGAITSTDLPMPMSSVSGSSNGAAPLSTYDAGVAVKPDAPIADSGSAFDVSSTQVVGVEASVPCNAQSCSNGCCDTVGRCQGTANNACGKGGGSCVDCTLTGGTCKANACTGSTSSSSSSSSSSGGGRGGGINLLGCNPIICWYGCCQDDGTCAVSSNTSCGTLGSQCVKCTANQACVVGACL